MKKKKVLISGYYGFNNFGDESILKVLVNKLKLLKADVTVLSKNPIDTAYEYKVKSVKSFDFFKVKKAIKDCDVLISGGGSLLQDVTSLKSLLYYLWVINSALKKKKEVIIFAQGIGPINSFLGRFLVKRALRKCSWVSVRDDKSLFLLRGWGVKTDLVCDPLFEIELPGSNPQNIVGVQLRDFKTLKEPLLIKLANKIVNDFPNKKIEIFSLQDSIDLEVCQRFESILKSINPSINTEVVFNKKPKEIMERISRLEYMIAMRFHANLIALKCGVKTLAICYDEKVEKLANFAQIPALSMLANENYDYLFNRMRNLDKRALISATNNMEFDWLYIEKAVKVEEK